MSVGTVVLIILVLLLLGALPTWPYSTGWGYYPSGGIGLVVIILLILVFTGKNPSTDEFFIALRLGRPSRVTSPWVT